MLSDSDQQAPQHPPPPPSPLPHSAPQLCPSRPATALPVPPLSPRPDPAPPPPAGQEEGKPDEGLAAEEARGRKRLEILSRGAERRSRGSARSSRGESDSLSLSLRLSVSLSLSAEPWPGHSSTSSHPSPTPLPPPPTPLPPPLPQAAAEELFVSLVDAQKSLGEEPRFTDAVKGRAVRSRLVAVLAPGDPFPDPSPQARSPLRAARRRPTGACGAPSGCGSSSSSRGRRCDSDLAPQRQVVSRLIRDRLSAGARPKDAARDPERRRELPKRQLAARGPRQRARRDPAAGATAAAESRREPPRAAESRRERSESRRASAERPAACRTCLRS